MAGIQIRKRHTVFLGCFLVLGNFGASSHGQVDTSWPASQSLQESWAALPAADIGNGSALPTWARKLARTLPHTTAAMLELETLYRTEPLVLPIIAESIELQGTSGARLAGVARYSVAAYHGSAYGLATAIADLKRANSQSIIDAIEKNPKELPPLEYEIFAFAAQLAKLGRAVSDEQYRSLQKVLGDEAMVGLVLRVAHGCFQDRLLLALGIAGVADGNLEPTTIRFVDSMPNGANTPTAMREDNEELLMSIAKDKQLDAPKSDVAVRATSTDDLGSTTIQQMLENQRIRNPRIAVPNWDSISSKLPPDLYRRPLQIRWSRVVVGYQPKLGPAWIKCLRVFEQEAHQDRVFEESVFWVVTRGLQCFYCMGHCEMLMEVGGLKRTGIAERTSRLASGDWSTFSKGEQAAFQFAKKLTEAPATVGQSDVQSLRETLGDTRAVDLIWWASRCQFMTKVSDAFQLQLERENVFAD